MILNVETPEYYLDAFPRESFPQYVWTERPPELPAAAWTTETTHRDGQQGGLPLTTEQSLRIYDILCAFTGVSGAIRQAEFFVYHPADRAALQGALERWRAGALIEPTTWIRAAAKDVALIKALGVRETGMLALASDYHTFHKFKPGGRRQAAETYLDAVRMAVDAGFARACISKMRRAPRSISFVRLWRLCRRFACPAACALSSASAIQWASVCPTTTWPCRGACRA